MMSGEFQSLSIFIGLLVFCHIFAVMAWIFFAKWKRVSKWALNIHESKIPTVVMSKNQERVECNAAAQRLLGEFAWDELGQLRTDAGASFLSVLFKESQQGSRAFCKLDENGRLPGFIASYVVGREAVWVCFSPAPEGEEHVAEGSQSITAGSEVELNPDTDPAASLITSAKLSSLGEMAASICHEVNNPLAIVSGHAELILEIAQSDELDMDMLVHSTNTIHGAALRVGKIIKGLRTFARQEVLPDGEFFHLQNGIEEALDLCKYRLIFHEIEIRKNYPEEDVVTDCNMTQLQQVVLNLCNNVVDALEGVEEKWVQIDAGLEGEDIVISVMDSGPGIEKDLADKILEPFFTTKKAGKGTGLGLSVAVRFADVAGGTFVVDHECPNTRFILRFPQFGQIQAGLESSDKEEKAAA